MKFPEKYRVNPKGWESNAGEGGVFQISKQTPFGTAKYLVIASNGLGWDHVSVSMAGADRGRCPKWEEMCFIKDLFFDKNETVIQYHPPESEYVNNHKFCLHLWRKQNYEYPLPPSLMVGIKGITLPL